VFIMQYPMSMNHSKDEEYEVGCFGCGKFIHISQKEFEERMFHYCRKCLMRSKDVIKNKVVIVPPYHTQYSLAIDRELAAKDPPFNFR
jgi:late competence protein required for DNA uptake (superfamily II DNA/RNA helicase)